MILHGRIKVYFSKKDIFYDILLSFFKSSCRFLEGSEVENKICRICIAKVTLLMEDRKLRGAFSDGARKT